MSACTHESERMFRSGLDWVRESLNRSQEEHTALQSYTTIQPCAMLCYAVIRCLYYTNRHSEAVILTLRFPIPHHATQLIP